MGMMAAPPKGRSSPWMPALLAGHWTQPALVSNGFTSPIDQELPGVLCLVWNTQHSASTSRHPLIAKFSSFYWISIYYENTFLCSSSCEICQFQNLSFTRHSSAHLYPTRIFCLINVTGLKYIYIYISLGTWVYEMPVENHLNLVPRIKN